MHEALRDDMTERAPRRPRVTLLLWLILPAVLIMYVRLIVGAAAFEDKDFSHLWLGGRMVVEGHVRNLYNPELQVEVYRQAHPQGRPPEVWAHRNDILGCFNYPPHTAVAYALLAWMPLARSGVVQSAVTLGLTLLSAWLLFRILDRRLPYPVVALALLAFPPFFINLSLGQNAVVTMSVVLSAWFLAGRGRDLAAGLLLGLLICKPNWWLAVLWIPLIHRRWRMCLGMVVASVFLVVGTVVPAGIQPYVAYADLFQKLARLHELPNYVLDMKYNGLSLFRKWFGMGTPAALLGWSACLVIGLLTWKSTWRRWATSPVAVWSACLTASLWVNPHINHYDLMLLSACVLAGFSDWSVLSRLQRGALGVVAALCYLAVPWDRNWTLGLLLPVPTFAILLLWGWTIGRLRMRQAVSEVPMDRRA